MSSQSSESGVAFAFEHLSKEEGRIFTMKE